MSGKGDSFLAISRLGSSGVRPLHVLAVGAFFSYNATVVKSGSRTMKYFSWRNLFIVLVLVGITWYVFNHQNEAQSLIEKLKAQLF